jgi:hypothetical protein
MSPPKKKNAGKKANVFVWTFLVVLLIAVAVAIFALGRRASRAVQATNQLQQAMQEAIQKQQMIVRAPARREFSTAFLQMAFGDNPPLLNEIKKALSEALVEKPALAYGEVALMLATYRQAGDLRDVALHIFGDFRPEQVPAFSAEGFFRYNLPAQLYDIGNTMLSVLGRDVIILAKDPETMAQQRAILEAILSGRADLVREYLYEPVAFIGVVPDPARLLTEDLRPYMAAALLKGKISMDDARAEIVILSFDAAGAARLGQQLSDLRLLAIGTSRLRWGGTPRALPALNALSQTQIRVEGPTVVVRSSADRRLLDDGMMVAVRVLGKGVRRIRHGPGIPF